MLQTQKSSPALEMPAAVPEETNIADTASFVLGFVRRQYLLLLLATLVATSIGITYLRITPPTYTAKAQIIIDRGKSSPFLQQQAMFPDMPVDNAQVESQSLILTSQRIAASAVKNLHLTEDPEFVGTAGGGLLHSLRVRLADSLRWLALDVSRHDELNKSDSDLVNQAAAGLLRNLQVNRIGMSFVIEIDYRSRSPERAAQVANAIAEAYISDQIDAKYETQRRASDFLQTRVNELRQQAGAREDALNAYKTKNNIVTAGGTLLKEQETAELNKQLVQTREKTSESLARLNRIEFVLSHADAGGALDAGRSDSSTDGIVSDVLTNPIITKLRQQYLELVNREADFSARYGKDHAAVVNLRNQIRDNKNSILNELRRLAETFKSDYLISKQRQESVEKDLARSVAQSQETNKAQATLRELESSAQSTRSLYDLWLKQYMESLQQQTYVATEARVVAPAIPPDQKSSPKTVSILALSVLGGLGFGVGLGFLRDMMDRVFRTAQQVEAIIGVPCVALVPLLKEGPKSRTPSPRIAALGGPRTIRREVSAEIFWTVVDSPLSGFAEGIRSIKLAADLQRVNGLTTVIGFTSSVPNEGKSTTAASLALLIGQVGERVIMIDCDLRNPSATRALAPNATAGLIEVLSGEKSVEDVTWRCPTTNLTFLPATQNSRLLHTSEILASAATKKLLEQLRLSYDYIVIDLPPLAPIIDVRATAHLVDFYFLVVEWGGTKIDVVQHALSRARLVYENLAGVVLNKADMDRIGRYDIHRRDYYDNKHYVRYGYTT
jgi:polysaccharide biosynthesis transport protein